MQNFEEKSGQLNVFNASFSKTVAEVLQNMKNA
jgi:hypothetical protein